MTPEIDDAAIDDIIASCNGDLRGALKALLLVNEQLESELRHLYAVSAHGQISRSNTTPRGEAALH